MRLFSPSAPSNAASASRRQLSYNARSSSSSVTVNVICPGYIDTEMVAAVPENVLAQIIAGIPVGRLGKGEEIADMVSFLAGERAGFVTGATLTLNGGQYMAA